jgi:hypothetical protein
MRRTDGWSRVGLRPGDVRLGQEGIVRTPFRITAVAVLLASLLSALAACAAREERSGTRDSGTEESGRRSDGGNGGGGSGY